jgi:hypothetical protein
MDYGIFQRTSLRILVAEVDPDPSPCLLSCDSDLTVTFFADPNPAFFNWIRNLIK